MKKILKFLLFLLILLVIYVGLSYYQVNRKGERIVYIKDGNIWVADKDGNNPYNLTNRKFEKLKNATRIFTPWCVEGDPRDCSKVEDNVVDVSNYYYNNFFKTLSLSPDGEYLAAFGYNDSVKKAIEANTKELNQKYLTGEYWFPQHYSLYIFDLINKKSQVFDLEKNFIPGIRGASVFAGVTRVDKIIWSPRNTHLTFLSEYGELSKFEVKTQKIYKITDSKFKVEGEWPANGHVAFYPLDRSIYYVNSLRLGFKKDTIVRKMFTYDNPPLPDTEFTVENEFYFAGPFTGNKDNFYLMTKKDDKIKVYEYNIIRRKLYLIKAINMFGFINESERYSQIKAISPNGKYILLAKEDHWGIFRLTDMKEVVSSKIDNDLTPYYFEWSLDGEKFISCNKNLTIFDLKSGTKKKLNSINCSDPENKPAFDWNYLD